MKPALHQAGITAEIASDPKGKEKVRGRRKDRDDLRFRMAYTKPELSLILPFGHTTLEEMIKRGTFPDGMRAHPTAHKIWPRRLIEDWLDRSEHRRRAE